MRRISEVSLLLVLAGLTFSQSAWAGSIPGADFKPDPKSVQRYGPAYRYPQAGWTVLHIEGEPYARGYQHGRLMAPEIAAFVRCFAAMQSPKAPSEGWKLTRTLVNALFIRRYEKEYLEEMKGIADGAAAAGARFDNRAIDLVDIVGINSWPEVDTLDSALGATATGLEGTRFKHDQPLAMPKPKPMHCSAFAATGPATADGKVVFGHITMFGLYPSLFYNVWLDVKPTRGYRVLMQTYPGGIQSGLDYYLNSAGLLVCETTIAQTKLDITGMTVASRIRQALQYANTIDKAVEILAKGNNGLYTNEWLLADVNTNEIAMFELGTHKSKLYRSGKDEWPGGTKGFYWGCNNTKDLQVRLETVASVNGRPSNVVFRPSPRDKKWLDLYDKYKGKMDAEFGKIAFTTPPIAAYHSLDAKFTTTDMAKSLKTWALFGPPLGRTWEPTQAERKQYPEVRPLVSNPWAVLHAAAPEKGDLKGAVVADLYGSITAREEQAAQRKKDKPAATVPAWHGTLLPKTDADTWLAAAFAEYERIYSLEKALKKQAGKKGLSTDERDRLAVALYAYRSSYLAAARAGKDVPLTDTAADLRRDEWYRVAAGKGVWLLHSLRTEIGDDRFEKALDSFGRENAGKTVTTAQFQAHLEKSADQKLDSFFSFWLKETKLPDFWLGEVRVGSGGPSKAGPRKGAKSPNPLGKIRTGGKWVPQFLEVTIESKKAETTHKVKIRIEGAGDIFGDGALRSSKFFSLPDLTGAKLEGRPVRVVVDKYGQTAKGNGGIFSTTSFQHELDHTLIVYGTADEVPSNREAAKALQKAIITAGPNQTVAIKSDKEVTDADLKGHHLLLIGRPDTNPIVERFRPGLPITFGSRSFEVRGKTYAHPRSAVVVAAENPLNKRFSVVVVAGLSAEATLRAAPAFVTRGQAGGEVLLLANGEAAKALVLPARELVKDLGKHQKK
jgi:hypothetical protein